MDREQELSRFYRGSSEYREMLIKEDTPEKFLPYSSLISCGVDKGAFGLDFGCGTGTSSVVLTQAGYRVVGMDFSSAFRRDMKQSFVQGNGFYLPFKDSSFDFVGMNAVIEHIPDVARFLNEVIRVLKQNGCLIIWSTNLLSPMKPAKALAAAVGVNIPHRNYGTGLQALGHIFLNIVLIVKKALSKQYKLTYITPQLEKFAGPDDDAVYLSNPIDLVRCLKRRGFIVKKRSPPSLPVFIRLMFRCIGPFGPGIGILAWKP